MWVFGHLGVGSRIVRPFSRGLPLRWILLGTLLPDVIDKPLFFVERWRTGDLEGTLITCTRTFGHSGLFLLAVLLFSIFRRSRVAGALAIGVASHALLDGMQDAVFHRFFDATGESSTLLALLYPFHEARFAAYPFESVQEHSLSLFHPFVLGAELLGVLIVYHDFIRKRLARKREIPRA